MGITGAGEHDGDPVFGSLVDESQGEYALLGHAVCSPSIEKGTGGGLSLGFWRGLRYWPGVPGPALLSAFHFPSCELALQFTGSGFGRASRFNAAAVGRCSLAF